MLFSSHGIGAHKINMTHCWCLTFITWLTLCLSGFSRHFHTPLFHSVLFRRKSLCTAQPPRVTCAPPPCGQDIYRNYLKLFFYERYVYSTLLIDCLTDTWFFIFYFWVISNTTYFLAQSISALAIGNDSVDPVSL